MPKKSKKVVRKPAARTAKKTELSVGKRLDSFINRLDELEKRVGALGTRIGTPDALAAEERQRRGVAPQERPPLGPGEHTEPSDTQAS